MRAIVDGHNPAKHLAEDKLEEMAGPPSKAVVKTQLKKSERTLRGTISGAIFNMNRMSTQQMTQAQYHEAGPLVKELWKQVQEEYRVIVYKLESMILSEKQASEEDTTLLKTTKEFLAWVLMGVHSIRTKMKENMPQLEQTMGLKSASQEDEAAQAPPERKAVRVNPQYILVFHDSKQKTHFLLAGVERWALRNGPGERQVCYWTKQEVGRGELKVNFKTHLSLGGVEGWALRV